MDNKQLSLIERWELDIKSYKQGVKVETAVPQCEKCKYYIKGNALYCEMFKAEKKPKHVIFIKKECNSYISNDYMNIKDLSDDKNKLYGGIFGFCVGDMLGVPVEFSSREERKKDEVKELRAYGTYHQPFGTWSDDTSMTLCLIDAINQGFSLDKLMRNFVMYYSKALFTPNGEVFDIGISTQSAIERMILGIEPINCGGIEESDNGNGSLMRILPIAFLKQQLDDEKFIKLIEDVSTLTHGHNRTKLACIIYTVFVSELIQGKEKKKAFDKAIAFVNKFCKEKYLDEFKNFKKIISGEIIEYSEKSIKSTGYVIDTLEAVVWLFFNSTSYEEAVLKAVNLGGDTDTIAAIVGGLSGIYYGINNIPNRWVQNIIRKHEIKELIDNFSVTISNEKLCGNLSHTVDKKNLSNKEI